MAATLISFRASHYCEKARWALDRQAEPYQEVFWAPGPHIIASKRLKLASTTTPILKTNDRIVQGSDRILDHLGWPQTHPDIEQFLDQDLAVQIRRAFYFCAMLDENFDLKGQFAQDLSGLMGFGFQLMWPVTKRLMVKGFGIEPAQEGAARAALEQALAQMDKLIVELPEFNSRELTRLMLAGASLLAPLALPPNHPIYAKRPMPPEWLAAADACAARPAIAWTRDVYQQHRS